MLSPDESPPGGAPAAQHPRGARPEPVTSNQPEQQVQRYATSGLPSSKGEVSGATRRRPLTDAEIDAVEAETARRLADVAQHVPTVTIPRAEWAQTTMFAESWLRFWAGDYLDDLVDQRMRAISHDLSGTMRWSEIGPRHTELAKLRAQPAWVSTCSRSGCCWQETVYRKELWSHLCPRHREPPTEAAA